MQLKITQEQAQEAMFAYANVNYSWGGQSKDGIDCSGLVCEVWEDWGFKSEGFDTTADKLYDGYRTGSLKGTKLSKGQFGALAFYGSNGEEDGTNAGHVVFCLTPNYIFGANNGGKSVKTREQALSRRPNPAYVKIQPLHYRDDLLGIWMPDYTFAGSVVVPAEPTTKTLKVTSTVNFRTGPSLSAAVIQRLPIGQAVIVQVGADTKADGHVWVKATALGKTGWISNKYLK